MTQSVGPLTVLIWYLQNLVEYRLKWEQAFRKAFGHCPEVENIITSFMSERTSLRAALTLLIV